MNDPTPQLQGGMVECEVCLKEIPASGAMNDETSGYMMYFCGLECYGKWKQLSEENND